jgi:hypothetical protein
MSSWRTWGSVLAVGGLVLLAACSSPSDPKVDLTKAEPGLEQTIQKKWFPSLDVGAVSCPTKALARSKGKVSECTVLVENEPVRFKVIQTNGQGGIAPLRFEAILSTEKAEDFIMRRIKDVATVDCGTAAYFVRAPGKEFDCAVTATNGRPSVVYFRVVDSKGNIRFVRNT